MKPDRLEKIFIVSLFALLFLGYTALVLSRLYPPWVLLPLGAALPYFYLHFRDEKPLWLPNLFWTIATALFFIIELFILLRMGLSSRLILTLRDIILVLPIIRLLLPKKEREIYQIYGLSFAQILLATVLTTEFYFGVILFIFSLVFIFSLLLFNFQIELERHPRGEARQEAAERIRRRFASWRAALFGLALTFFFVLIAGFIFFIVPRPSGGLLWTAISHSQLMPGDLRSSGFSSHIKLGDVGRIKLDDAIAMRVRLSSPLPDRDRYIVGKIFNYFDGEAWEVTRRREFILEFIYPQTHRMYVHLPPEAVTEEFYLDRVGGDQLFYLYHPVVFKGELKRVTFHAVGNFRHRAGMMDLNYYQIEAAIPPVLNEDPMLFPEKYLELPPRHEELKSLADKIAPGAEPPAEKAAKILAYLKQNYQYSLERTDTQGRPSIVDFLFYQRLGHCEYFATAMALLLRAAGVPSKLVAGYQGGEYNALENYYIIRQSDAHTWVEAWMPESGWTRYDPTPSAGIPAETESNPWPVWARPWLGALDALRFRWHRYIVSYSLDDQFGFFRGVKFRLPGEKGPRFDFPRRSWAGARQAGEVVLIALAVLLLGAGLILGLRYLKQRAAASAQGATSELTRDYRRMLTYLIRQGVILNSSATHEEIRRRAQEHLPMIKSALDDYFTLYQNLRFSGRPAPRESLEELHNLARWIREQGKTD